MATQFNAWGYDVKYMQVGDSDIPSTSNQQIPSPHHAKPAGTLRAAEDETVVLSVLPHQHQRICYVYMRANLLASVYAFAIIAYS